MDIGACSSDDEGDSKIAGSGKQKVQWIVVEELSDGIKKKDEATVFVKPIPEAVLSKYELQEEFEGFGAVAHVHIDSQRKFAFVWFTEVEDANRVAGQVLSIAAEDVEVFPAIRPKRSDEELLKRLERKRQRKVVSECKITSDRVPFTYLLKLFGTALNPKSVDLLGSLPSEQTERTMESAVAAVELNNWISVDGICEILNSLDTKFPNQTSK